MLSSISFIIAAYNEEKYIQQCLWAIKRECHRYPSLRYEIIVIDNNSTDWTSALVKPIPGVILIEEKQQGVSAAREAGFKVAKNDILVFLDADTIMPLGWIAKLLKTMSKPGVIACSGPIHYYDGGSFINFGEKIFYPVAQLLSYWYPTLQGGNYAIRRKVLGCADGMDTSLKYWGEDTMTAVRVAPYGKVVLNPKMVMNASARRFQQDGLFKTIGLYILNYFWISLKGRPYSKEHQNFR